MDDVIAALDKLTDRKIKIISNDAEKSADAVHLVYVNDAQPGFRRYKRGNRFYYLDGKREIKDKMELQRIEALVIPPAWENVWICKLPNGHLQVTGLDSKKRKQYKYHPRWSSLRNYTKFYRLEKFGKALPGIRHQLQKDLSLPGMPLEKVMATVVSLMERTNIRVGNGFYEKLYGSFGLTTFKGRHVEVSGATIKFSFKGKKGVHHDISIRNKRLSDIIKKCIDIPGKELFQYYNDEGEKKPIDSGMVNEYIKRISKEDFTAKDFRTWGGTLHALMALINLDAFESHSEAKKNIVEALDIVSWNLGNTRAVCRKYYVHPIILELYANKELEKYLSHLNSMEVSDDRSGLTAGEKILLEILENH